MMKQVSINVDYKITNMVLSGVIAIGNYGLPLPVVGNTSSHTQAVPSEEVDAKIASV